MPRGEEPHDGPDVPQKTPNSTPRQMSKALLQHQPESLYDEEIESGPVKMIDAMSYEHYAKVGWSAITFHD